MTLVYIGLLFFILAHDSDEDHRVSDQHEPDLRHLSDAYSTNCNGMFYCSAAKY